MRICDQLKKRRIELQLSQDYVADKAGISRRTLAYYESGDRTPNAENLLVLCNIYGLDANDLLVGDMKMTDKPDYVGLDKDVISKVDEYLKYHQIRKDTYKRIILFVCILITFFSLLLCGLATLLKFFLYTVRGYEFGDATAKFWTDFFNTMIDFVNDPAVKGYPIVTFCVLGFYAIGWTTYFVVRYIKRRMNRVKKDKEWTIIHTFEHICTAIWLCFYL